MILLQIDRESIAVDKLESNPPRPIHGHRVTHWICARERVRIESCAGNFANMRGAIQHGQTVQAALAKIRGKFCSTSGLEKLIEAFVSERSDQIIRCNT